MCDFPPDVGDIQAGFTAYLNESNRRWTCRALHRRLRDE